MGIESVKAQAVLMAGSARASVPARNPESDFTKAQSSTQSADSANRTETSGSLAESTAGPDPVVKSAPKRAGTRLSVDAETKRIVASIIDETNREIRQIPPEESLRIAARTRQMTALLFDESG